MTGRKKETPLSGRRADDTIVGGVTTENVSPLKTKNNKNLQKFTKSYKKLQETTKTHRKDEFKCSG